MTVGVIYGQLPKVREMAGLVEKAAEEERPLKGEPKFFRDYRIVKPKMLS